MKVTVSPIPQPDASFYRSLIDAIPIPVFVVDSDIYIHDCNTAAKLAFDLDGALVYRGRGGEVLHCIHAQDSPEGCGKGPFCHDCEIRNAVALCLSGGVVHRKRLSMSLVRNNNLVEVEVLLTVTPLPSADETLVLLMLEDLSEITALQNIFTALLDSTTDIVFSVNTKYELVTFNYAFCRYVEDTYEVKVAVGMTYREVLPPDSHATWDALFARALREKSLQIDMPLMDGRIMDLAINLIERNGETTGFALFGKDITSRKIAEQELRESEERNRATFEQAAIGISRTDLDGTWLDVNQAFCDLTGYTRDELLRMKFQDISHPDDVASNLLLRDMLLSGKLRSETMEKRYFHKNGSLIWIRLNVAIVRTSLGAPVYFVSTIEDITARKNAENEVMRLTRARGVLSGINRAIARTNDESELLRNVVDIFVHVGGYPLAWIGIAMNDAEHSVTVAASAGKAKKYVQDVTITWDENKDSGNGPTGIALREGLGSVVQRYAGNSVMKPWVEAANKYGLHSNLAVPLLVSGCKGMAIMIYSEAEDAFSDDEIKLIQEAVENLQTGITAIRDRKAAEAERLLRAQIEEQLQQSQKMEAIGRLAGGIAHDFNNLLMVIMAQTELLRMNLTGPAVERADKVMRSAWRAAELTKQLLAFSRKNPRQPTVTTMNRIVDDLSDMLKRIMGEDVEIRTQLCEKLWNIQLDESQFGQVIMNLVVNARDAMPEGGILSVETSNVEISEEHHHIQPLIMPGKYSMLAISDSGIGIKTENISKIFDPFFTTKDPGKGTGLGLSMVYGIVKQNGGYITVDSEPGKSTCFKIYIPVVESDAQVQLKTEAVPSPVNCRKACIMLVEDEDDLRGILSEYLKSGGHHVLAAASSGEALHIAMENQTRIDLLISDVVLKDGNGKQLAASLAEGGHTFPVLFISGYTPDTIVRHGVLEPSTAFLQKPFSKAVLLDKVNQVLAN